MILALSALLLQPSLPAATPSPAAPWSPASPPRPLAPLGSLIQSADYPKKSLRRDEEGIVYYRMRISAKGRVARCAIVQSSGYERLDNATCALVTERARFFPARDPDQKPVPGDLVGRAVWRIKSPLMTHPVGQVHLVGTMTATPAGAISCSTSLEDYPQPDHCASETADRLSEMAREEGRTFDHVIRTKIALAGEVPAVEAVVTGAPIFETEAAVDLAADGSIKDCRILRSEALAPLADRIVKPSPCAAFAPGPRRLFDPAADVSERSLDVTVRVFLSSRR
jgi:TonB family protein